MAKKILIVEDEKALATVLNLKLKSTGYETQVVYNGDDALAAVKAGPFDLLIIDIMMPKRDGFGVLEDLKKIGNKVPLFVMSNLGQTEDIDRIKSYGIKEYIVKADTSPGEIAQKITSFLGS